MGAINDSNGEARTALRMVFHQVMENHMRLQERQLIFCDGDCGRCFMLYIYSEMYSA